MTEVLHNIICPDGTQFRVYTDGSWIHETWDGQFARSSQLHGSTTPEEVLAKLATVPSGTCGDPHCNRQH